MTAQDQIQQLTAQLAAVREAAKPILEQGIVGEVEWHQHIRIAVSWRDNLAAALATPSPAEALLEDKANWDFLEAHEYSLMCWNVDGKINNGWTLHISDDEEIQGQTARKAVTAARSKASTKEGAA